MKKRLRKLIINLVYAKFNIDFKMFNTFLDSICLVFAFKDDDVNEIIAKY
jgi:hypothetical protein